MAYQLLWIIYSQNVALSAGAIEYTNYTSAEG